MENNEKFMKLAIKKAKQANKINEVPVGAVIVYDGKVISAAFNQRETKKDATAHAEILAIKKACKKLNDWRLENCEIFVTLEPCIMCVGAIMNARIKKLFFGAKDNKQGAAGSALDLAQKNFVSHNIQVEGGVCKNECEEILKEFFKSKRFSKQNVDNNQNKE